jgi:hypothetical protein
VGLITGLLTLPLAPVRGVAWLAEHVSEQAWRELYDEEAILRELAEAERAHEEGGLGDDELERVQDALLERLTIAREGGARGG